MTTIEKWFAQPENAKIYSDWISDPATKQFLSMAQECTRPLGLANPTGEAALYLQGLCVGAHKLLDFLQHLELFAATSAENKEPESTFGSEEILRDWDAIPRKIKGD